jgi:serine O-acetyltransferase
MSQAQANLTSVDPVWTTIRSDAEEIVRIEPLMASLAHSGVLHHRSLERALSFRIAQKLTSPEMSELILREIAATAYEEDPSLGAAARADILAVYDRDPACHRYIQPLLYFKGFQALQCYRIANWLWRQGREDMARFLQMRTSEAFGVDVHPNARIGRGVMIDHAHSIVIGETAVVGDNVSMLHSVTLGGTGKEDGDRHPKIGNGVLIGAGAAILGNIVVGNCSRIAAGSVVLEPVPPMTTVAGVPARVVGKVNCTEPARTMDQMLGSDPGREIPRAMQGCDAPGCLNHRRS